MRVFFYFLLLIIIAACNTANEANHPEPTHNFTVDRILIINEKNELLLGREQNVWAAPYTTFDKRQFLNESQWIARAVTRHGACTESSTAFPSGATPIFQFT